MLTLFYKDFAPQIKSIEAIICQRLIILNNIPKPKDIQETNDATISREPFDSQKDINKSLNFIRTHRKIKNYFKILNIEEEPYSKSD